MYIRVKWPAHLNLVDLMVPTMVSSLKISVSPLFVFILYFPCSFVSPQIDLSTVRSKQLSADSSFCVNDHVSQVYVTMGRIL